MSEHVKGSLPLLRGRGRSLLPLVAICLIASLERAAAQQRVPATAVLREMSLEQLGSLEVFSVSKQSEAIWNVPAALSVITQEDIRRSGATSIPEALRLAPGVEVARIDGNHWSVGIRGFGDQFSKALLVLIDGRNIYSPLFAGAYWPAHDLMLEDVERIEVIRGPGGTIWGGNAVSGVINVVTKRTAETIGTLTSVGVGTTDRGSAAIRHGGGLTGNADYRVFAKGFTRAAQHHPDRSDFDGDTWKSQAGFRIDWGRDSRSLTLQGDLTTGQHGQRVVASSLAPPSIYLLDGLVDTSGGNLLAAWEQRTQRGQIRLQGSFERAHWLAPHFEETRSAVDTDYVQDAAWSRQHLTWGAGFRWSPATFAQTIPILDFVPAEATFRVFSGFAQDEFHLVPGRLSLTAGSKFEHNSYTGAEAQPSVRLLWMPGPRQTIWSAVTRAVRTPSRIEREVRSTTLASLAGPVYLRIVGSDDFDAERMVGYEAGYRALIGSLYFAASGYYNAHTGLVGYGRGSVMLDSGPGPRRFVIELPHVNGVDGHTSGFELLPDWRPHPTWRLSGAYAYRHFSLESQPVNLDPNAVSRYAGSTPSHLVRVQSNLTVAGRWEIDAAYRYADDLPARSVPSYHTADARVGVRLGNGVRLAVEGQNLLQPEHPEFNPAVGIRRNVTLRLTWERAGTR